MQDITAIEAIQARISQLENRLIEIGKSIKVGKGRRWTAKAKEEEGKRLKTVIGHYEEIVKWKEILGQDASYEKSRARTLSFMREALID